MAEDILEKLDASFKAVTVTGLGESVLAPEQFDRFVRSMQARALILPDARFITMGAQVTHIDRIGFVGRVLTAGVATGDTVVGTETSVAPTTVTNKLIAKEMRGLTGINDRALRRSIEQGDFEGTLVDMFGEAAGRDLEEWGLFADEGYTDDLLSLGNGWIQKAGNKVYGVESSGAAGDEDFDPAAAQIETMFAAMLDALPKQFLINRAEWRFYVPYEMEDAYRNILKARGTALGDAAQVGNAQLMYKGIPVVYAPMLERAGTEGATTGTGKVAMLTHPDNTVWGVFEEVTIEKEREAKLRRTDFVLTIEADVHYEDENAVVIAYAERAKVL